MTTATQRSRQDFPAACRQWRQYRKLSQLDLALAANVSQRHVSWLETGRSQPSREMVVRLADAMEIPLRERNLLFQAAGYAAAYRETPLDEPAMAPVLDALNHVLHNHEPLPAVVVDRFWNVKKRNRAADLMLGIGGDPAAMLRDIGDDGELNLALLTVHPRGLRRYIVNWEQAGSAFVRRLKSEALASGDPRVQAQFARYIELAGPLAESETMAASLLPVLPLELSIDGLALSLFSVISTFGTPQDITTDELRIEAFYPTNPATAEFFRSMA
jgi:transcriptional regulator with XRE-family HTH domain